MSVKSEFEFQRLRRQMKIYQAVALVLVIAAVVRGNTTRIL